MSVIYTVHFKRRALDFKVQTIWVKNVLQKSLKPFIIQSSSHMVMVKSVPYYALCIWHTYEISHKVA